MTKSKLKEFLKDKAIHCDSKTKASILVNILVTELKASFRYDIPGETYWHVYKEDTCYSVTEDNIIETYSIELYPKFYPEVTVISFERFRKKLREEET